MIPLDVVFEWSRQLGMRLNYCRDNSLIVGELASRHFFAFYVDPNLDSGLSARQFSSVMQLLRGFFSC
jgi:hypothetical protein